MMNSPRQYLSFQTKVLLPVITVMVLLVSITIWLVNRRITRQLQTEAAQSLATADGVFRNSQKLRARNLLQRYRNVPNEPRYKAVFQLAEPKTLRVQLNDMIGELGGDLVLFKTEEGKVLASAKSSPLLSSNEFESRSAVSTGQAQEGLANVDIIQVSERLFDVVSIPVTIGDHIIGALTFGAEVGEAEAQEFSQLARSRIVFLVNGRVAATSFQKPELYPALADLFGAVLTGATNSTGRHNSLVKKVSLGDEHFLCLADKFDSLSGDTSLGYLLLSSYEQPLRELQETQRTLFLVSLLGILFSTAFVWLLVRKITQPLRQLRAGAEAVGRGDFSPRVPVSSRDECGELAEVFNAMTQNLKQSRDEMETIVQTLKTTQAQLIQNEKLSAIGEFVAGVTHELNNPLTALIGFAELLQKSGVDDRQRRFSDRIVQSAQRCHKIVQSLLSFARQHPPERKLARLNELIDSTVDFMAYEMRTSNIEITTHLSPNLPPVMGDPHQLQQVFLNLLNNSRQAIEEHQPRGLLRICSVACGDHVRISFQDDGPGISQENLKKIFNPFFTTKEAGKGTGLGLSLSYGIIKEHGGSISAQSQRGAGATFIIELPIACPDSALESDKPVASQPAPSLHEGQGKRVLVVDDEEPILDLVSEVLASRGYQVDTAHDGATALRHLGQNRYDVTLCDWKMPGLNGQQVYEKLRILDAGAAARLVFMTGDVINDKTQSFLKQHEKLCLSKPFKLTEFLSLIREFLKAA